MIDRTPWVEAFQLQGQVPGHEIPLVDRERMAVAATEIPGLHARRQRPESILGQGLWGKGLRGKGLRRDQCRNRQRCKPNTGKTHLSVLSLDEVAKARLRSASYRMGARR